MSASLLMEQLNQDSSDNYFLDWIKRESLLDFVDSHYLYFKNILNGCLNVKKYEHVLIVTDYGYPSRRIAPIIAANYYAAALSMGVKVKLVAQNPKLETENTDEAIYESFMDLKKESIILLCLSDKLGSFKRRGKSFRPFAREMGHRFASIMGLSSLDTEYAKEIIDLMNVDYEHMQHIGNRIKTKLEQSSVVEVKTDKGTHITFNVDKSSVRVAAGDYKAKGTGGNIPVGETYCAPLNMNGVVVIDGSLRTTQQTIVLNQPVHIHIKDGRVESITGPKETADALMDSLKGANDDTAFLIGEFGIGFNYKARLIGNMMVDEKTANTAHIACGSNAWFGGPISSPIHLDQVFKHPQIFIDGKKLEY